MIKLVKIPSSIEWEGTTDECPLLAEELLTAGGF